MSRVFLSFRAKTRLVGCAGFFAGTAAALYNVKNHVNSSCEGERKVEPKQKAGRVDVVLGAQWGDEGKGKLVDILGFQYNVCARVAGGSNAGHTINANGKQYKFHLVPSGILNPSGVCMIGNGVVVHLRGLLEELDQLSEAGVDYDGRLLLSDRAHIVFDFHQLIDGRLERTLARKGDQLGTTGKGIGPAYGSKAMRNGLRVGDLREMRYFEHRLRLLVAQLESAYPGLCVDVDKELAYYSEIRKRLLPMITDTVSQAHSRLDDGVDILVEGANATMIDIDFGTYPFVTSSNPTIGSVCTGLGVPPQSIRHVIGIVKAYCTRVGEGPFPTEQSNGIGACLRQLGAEFGTTTGRERRCGWVDVPQLRYASKVNGFTCLNLTKLDVLTGFQTVKIGVRYMKLEGGDEGKELKTMPSDLSVLRNVWVEYEELPGWDEDISSVTEFSQLPPNCQTYVLRLEELVGVPIRWIGTGPGRNDMIDRSGRVEGAGGGAN